MTEQDKTQNERRRFLKTAGQAALAVPLAGLAACSGGSDSPPPAAEPAPAASTPPPAEMPQAEPAAAAEPEPAAAPEPASSEPVRLNEADPQAKSLGYVHDATTIDTSAQPRYEAGQACRNCVLFQGADGDEWANCSIFPGRQVKATGWCSVYAPKAS